MKKIIAVVVLVSYCHTQPLQKGETSQTQDKEILRYAQYDNQNPQNNKDLKDDSNPYESQNLQGEQSGDSLTNKQGEVLHTNNPIQARDAITPLESKDFSQASGLIIGIESSLSTFGFAHHHEIETTTINNTSTAQGGTTTTTTITPIDSFDMRGIGGGYGLIVGYEGFWRQFASKGELGMRIYGDLHATHTHFSNAQKSLNPIMLRYGVNVDALLDYIIAQNSLHLGGFIGVRIGGKSYVGKDIDTLDTQMRQLGDGFPKASFDLALNLGARAKLAQHHGIELIFSVPFFVSNFNANSLKVAKTNAQTTNTTTRLSGDFTQYWSVGVRYIYTFSGL
ncbi:outer membrane beta-barrel protein [Helicobacter sp. 23-1046]